VLLSERGFLEMAGRDDGTPLREAFLHFRDLVSADMDWADSRKARFRTRASSAKVAALALAAASTVVLGIPAIPNRAAIALPMVALVTLISALEPFFNWRSRWVLMEETQYRLNRIREEVVPVRTGAGSRARRRMRADAARRARVRQQLGGGRWRHGPVLPATRPCLMSGSTLE